MALSVGASGNSLSAQNALNANANALASAQLQLSTGLRINSAGDDAAGLAISTRLVNQINGLSQASLNANSGISLAQTAEGALVTVLANLQRIRTLAVQSQNSTNSTADRQALDAEVQQRIQEIQRIATQTSFNGSTLLDGTFTGAQFQVGANVGQTIGITGAAQNLQTGALGAFVSATGTAPVTVGVNATATSGQMGGVTFAPSPTGSAASGPAANTGGASYQGVNGTPISASTVALNGNYVAASGTFAGASTYQDATSAYAKAAAINGSGLAGVSATATTSLTFDGTANLALGVAGNSTWYSGSVTGNGILGYQLLVNGTSVASLTVSDYGGPTAGVISNAQVASGVNAVSSQTGVSAVANANGTLTFSAADGRNIVLQEIYSPNDLDTSTFVAASQLGTASIPLGVDGTLTNTATYRGQITLNSSASVTLGAPATNGELGWSVNTSVLQSAGALSGQNVRTAAAANSLVYSVDSALAQVNAYDAQWGALQNRLTSTVGTIGTSLQNLAAAKGRIVDADYAKASAQLSAAAIIQQAATAILGHANAEAQSVLRLLQ